MTAKAADEVAGMFSSPGWEEPDIDIDIEEDVFKQEEEEDENDGEIRRMGTELRSDAIEKLVQQTITEDLDEQQNLDNYFKDLKEKK